MSFFAVFKINFKIAVDKNGNVWYNNIVECGYGGIGRRASFRC